MYTLTSSWQGRLWWPFTSWTNDRNRKNEDDDVDDSDKNTMKMRAPQTNENYALNDMKRVQQRLSTLLNTDSDDRRRRTALDWMDLLEQDREMKQQDQHQRWLSLSSDPQESVNSKYNQTRVIDWLTYVDDALYNDCSKYMQHRTNSDQQSA